MHSPPPRSAFPFASKEEREREREKKGRCVLFELQRLVLLLRHRDEDDRRRHAPVARPCRRPPPFPLHIRCTQAYHHRRRHPIHTHYPQSLRGLPESHIDRRAPPPKRRAHIPKVASPNRMHQGNARRRCVVAAGGGTPRRGERAGRQG